MEKIRKQKSYRRSYGPVVIWLEDLTEITALLKENCKEVQISTADYRFGTVDELKEHVGSQAQFALEIDSGDPYVSIDFDRRTASLYVGAGAQAAYLFHEIDGIIERRQRRFPMLYRLWFLMACSAALWAVNYFFLADRTDTISFVLISLQAIFSLWFLWAWFVVLRRTSVVRLQRRSEARPFFERNRDQLLLLLIGAVMGGLVTFAGIVAKEHFYPSALITSGPKIP
jgi:hypothetical protein